MKSQKGYISNPEGSDGSDIIIKSCDIEPIYSDKININEETLGYSENYINVKNKIDLVNINTWNQIRRYTNNYEFPLKRRTGGESPISRAFFKMWEILHEYNLIDSKVSGDRSRVGKVILSIAEAPGGFVQAISKYLEVPFKIYTMSLIKKNGYIPKYNQRIFNNKNIHILEGTSKDGDIYNIDNIESIRRSMKEKAELITGDGGFNEDNKYNIKEQLHNKLFLSEIIIAISNQKFDGKLVIKFFDTYTKYSLDLVYILLFFYKDVKIYKPLTSRPTNSEKYIICSGFRKITNQHRKIICKLKKILPLVDESTHRILNISIPEDIINRLKSNNIILMQNQIKYINKNIDIINKITKNGKIVNKLPYIDRNNERNKWLVKYHMSN
jgi:23S rRNA U2552 (ribose-2'-O)-methylase RlmE/FtsJ